MTVIMEAGPSSLNFPSNLVHFMVEGVDYSKFEGFSYYDYRGWGSPRTMDDHYD